MWWASYTLHGQMEIILCRIKQLVLLKLHNVSGRRSTVDGSATISLHLHLSSLYNVISRPLGDVAMLVFVWFPFLC